MPYSATDSVTNAGSGRMKLPARLRASAFGATVVTALRGEKAVGHKSYTTTQRNALTGLTAGDTVYDSTLGYLVMWNGSAWKTTAGATPS